MSETRFDRLHDGREVAFRCLSDSPGTTIVYVPGGTTPIEVIEDDTMSARFLRTLGRYGSLVALDRLGIGADLCRGGHGDGSPVVPGRTTGPITRPLC